MLRANGIKKPAELVLGGRTCLGEARREKKPVPCGCLGKEKRESREEMPQARLERVDGGRRLSPLRWAGFPLWVLLHRLRASPSQVHPEMRPCMYSAAFPRSLAALVMALLNAQGIRRLLPAWRFHLHNALQSHRLPFWFGLAGSISGTVRCLRGQLYLGIPDTYPCRAARLSRWFWGTKSNRSPLSQGCGLSPLVLTPRARLASPDCCQLKSPCVWPRFR